MTERKLPSSLSYIKLSHQHRKIETVRSKNVKWQYTTNNSKLCVAQGWPKFQNQLNRELKPYDNLRVELTEVNNLILKGSKIFIPVPL